MSSPTTTMPADGDEHEVLALPLPRDAYLAEARLNQWDCSAAVEDAVRETYWSIDRYADVMQLLDAWHVQDRLDQRCDQFTNSRRARLGWDAGGPVATETA